MSSGASARDPRGPREPRARAGARCRDTRPLVRIQSRHKGLRALGRVPGLRRAQRRTVRAVSALRRREDRRQHLRPLRWDMELKLKPIGKVRRLSDRESVLEIDPAYTAGFHRARRGDRLEVFYWMHGLSAEDRRRLKVRPGSCHNRKLKGVFALRSPCRPNPLGATLVRLERLKGSRAWVSGLDARDGSPIIDIRRARKLEKPGVLVGRGQADLSRRKPPRNS